MVARRSLPIALIGFGVILLAVSAVPVNYSSDTDYVHYVEPATNGTLGYGTEYDERDVLAYENLSRRGQTVFDHARTDSPYIVENESAAAPDFIYTSDNTNIGHGLYPIRYSGAVYSIQTMQRGGGFNAAFWLIWLLMKAFRAIGTILIIAGVVLAGWHRYSRRS